MHIHFYDCAENFHGFACQHCNSMCNSQHAPQYMFNTAHTNCCARKVSTGSQVLTIFVTHDYVAAFYHSVEAQRTPWPFSRVLGQSDTGMSVLSTFAITVAPKHASLPCHQAWAM